MKKALSIVLGILSIGYFSSCGVRSTDKKRKLPNLADSVFDFQLKGIKLKDSLIFSHIKDLAVGDNRSIMNAANEMDMLFIGGEFSRPWDTTKTDSMNIIAMAWSNEMRTIQLTLFPLLRKMYVENLNRNSGKDLYKADGAELYCKVGSDYKTDRLESVVDTSQCRLLRFEKIIILLPNTQTEEHQIKSLKDYQFKSVEGLM